MTCARRAVFRVRPVTVGPVLTVSGLSVAYAATPALREVSLQVADGASVAVLGANGAGKSTLLRAVSGLVPATAGRVELDGVLLPGGRRTRSPRWAWRTSRRATGSSSG